MKDQFSEYAEFIDYNLIVDYFNRALFINNKNYHAYYFKGVALHNLERYDEALECYARCLALIENKQKDKMDTIDKGFIPGVPNYYGNALYKIARYEDARYQYLNAIEDSHVQKVDTTGDVRKHTYLNLAWCEFKLKDSVRNPRSAVSYVDKVLMSYHAEKEDEFNDGDLKEIDKLTIGSKKIVRIRALYIKGFIYLTENILQAALSFIDNSIKLIERYSLRDAIPYYYKGTILYQNGKYTDAIENYKRALKINPQFAESHDSLGVALTKRNKDSGDMEEAVDHVEKAVEISPSLITAQQHYIQIQSIRQGTSVTGAQEGPRFIRFWSRSWQRGLIATVLVSFAFLLGLYALNLFSFAGLPSTDSTKITNFTASGITTKITSETRTSTYSFILIVLIAIVIMSPDIQRC